jgi:hypothetical protein
MYSLREVLAQAQAAGTAIGHFNSREVNHESCRLVETLDDGRG